MINIPWLSIDFLWDSSLKPLMAAAPTSQISNDQGGCDWLKKKLKKKKKTSLTKSLFSSRKLVVATGIATPNVPQNVDGMEHVIGYEDVSINPEDFEGQSVLILGTLIMILRISWTWELHVLISGPCNGKSHWSWSVRGLLTLEVLYRCSHWI